MEGQVLRADGLVIKQHNLAYWLLSAFAQFSLFVTTMGRLANGHRVHYFVQLFLFSATTMGHLTHRSMSTFAKFSLFVTDQSKLVQLVIWFVGR